MDIIAWEVRVGDRIKVKDRERSKVVREVRNTYMPQTISLVFTDGTSTTFWERAVLQKE
jgi:hypothetical protein